MNDDHIIPFDIAKENLRDCQTSIFQGRQPLNLGYWFETFDPTTPDDFVLPGFLKGHVGAFVAPGGTGKSFLALEMALAVASPEADLLGFGSLTPGRVLYVNLEDDEAQIGRRLSWIARRLSPSAREMAIRNLSVYSITGDDNTLDAWDMGVAFSPIIDGIGLELGEFRLIILDTLSRLHQLDENSNHQMTRLTMRLISLAHVTKASILFVHHVNKFSIRENGGESQAASRGASALVDNVRYCSYMVKMTPEEAKAFDIAEERRGLYRRFGVSKQNYGEPRPDIWLERHEGGVLLPVELIKTNNKEIPHGAKFEHV